MSLLRSARLALRRFGIDVGRGPGFDPKRMRARLLEAHGVDVVLDIGANSGGYGEELRRAGYRGRIVSFEPLDKPYRMLAAKVARDSRWDAYRCAIGERNDTVTVNVAANAGESSSILPMLQAHVDAYPTAVYVGTQDADMRMLDSIAPTIVRPGERAFVKADVQGYERAVIHGGKQTIRDAVGLELELSFLPLYEDGMLFQEALELVNSFGLSLMQLIPGFTDIRNGRLLQADGVFMREMSPNRCLASSGAKSQARHVGKGKTSLGDGAEASGSVAPASIGGEMQRINAPACE